uniref:Secreted protein n=1 Tax=Heterorhabditis bacteriophora TaxID=37862 RepID=A0A1I7XC28_HETBA
MCAVKGMPPVKSNVPMSWWFALILSQLLLVECEEKTVSGIVESGLAYCTDEIIDEYFNKLPDCIDTNTDYLDLSQFCMMQHRKRPLTTFASSSSAPSSVAKSSSTISAATHEENCWTAVRITWWHEYLCYLDIKPVQLKPNCSTSNKSLTVKTICDIVSNFTSEHKEWLTNGNMFTIIPIFVRLMMSKYVLQQEFLSDVLGVV